MESNDSKLWTYHQTTNVINLAVGHPRQDFLYKKIRSLVEAQGAILEIGFGDGYLLKRLSNKYKCFGADVSVENIDQMKKEVPTVEFELIGVDGALPYPDNFFDCFVASEVLEHMTDEELETVVREIHRVLKNDGYLIVTFPVKENLKDSECFCPNCGTVFHKWGHKQYWDKKKIRSCFENFSVLEMRDFFTPFVGNNITEKMFGLVMWCARTIANKFVNIPGGTYLVVAKKR